MINSPSTSDLNKHQTPEQKITTKKIKQAILKGKIQLDNLKNTSNILSDKSYLKKYQRNTIFRMKEYNDLKEENSKFSKGFKDVTSPKQNEHATGFHKVKNQQEETFHDLFSQYRERGYNVPDLSVKKNLFKPSALLLEDHKLKDYYQRMVNSNEKEDKSSKFLVKLSNMVIDKVNERRNFIEGSGIMGNDKENSKMPEFAQQLKRKSSLLNIGYNNTNLKSLKTITKENAEMNKYNSSISKLIQQARTEKRIDSISKKKIINISNQSLSYTRSRNVTQKKTNKNVTFKTDTRKHPESGQNLKKFIKFSSKQIECKNENVNHLGNQEPTNLMNKTNHFKTNSCTQLNLNRLSTQDTKIDTNRSKKSLVETDMNPQGRRRILEYAYNKFTNNDLSDLNEIVSSYSKNIKKYSDNDVKCLLENSNDPKKILHLIEDLEQKIDLYDVNSIFMSNYSTLNLKDAASPSLSRVKCLDTKIRELRKKLTEQITKGLLGC